MNIQFGADPEFFIKNLNTGEYISAHNRVPGTKEKPFDLTPILIAAGVKGVLGSGWSIQADGTAVEVNFPPEKEILARLFTNVVLPLLAKKFLGKDEAFVFEPEVIYNKEYFQSLPEEAVELGCNPDYNIYTWKENPRPDSLLLKGLETMRTGGGHIHIGWSKNATQDDITVATKMIDFYFERFNEKDKSNRSKLYGCRGAFRPKKYGTEYRTPSNLWLVKNVDSVIELTKYLNNRFSQINGRDYDFFFNLPENWREDPTLLRRSLLESINGY